MTISIARTLCLSGLLCIGLSLAVSKECWAASKDKVKVWTDPALAAQEDADFLIQGEYRNEKDGLQVIAAGSGNFVVAVLSGGLPGDGWDQKTVRYERLKTADLKMKLDREVYKKVERESPTLGAKPPEGAIVLFDSAMDKKKVSEIWAEPEVADGLLCEKTNTLEKFGSFKLHLEFRLPYKPGVKPGDQDRGNSGVYIFNRYETQVLDSFGLHHGQLYGDKGDAWQKAFAKDFGYKSPSIFKQWCACFYKTKAVDVNMCYPPLQWQTYDITFNAPAFENGKKTKNTKITVLHNGVKVHDAVELEKGTGAGGSREEVAEESLYLQGHGNPVRYKNIWLLPLKN